MIIDENGYIAKFVTKPVFSNGMWSIKYRFTVAHRWETFSNPQENIVRDQYNALKRKLATQYVFYKQLMKQELFFKQKTK